MTTMTHESVCADHIRGVAGLAVRLGIRLERWGRRAAAQPDREQLRRNYEVRREALAAIEARGDARAGLSQLLR